MTQQSLETKKSTKHSNFEEKFNEFLIIARAVHAMQGENTILAVDTETNAEDIRDGRGYATGVSMAVRYNKDEHYVYMPFRHPGENLSRESLQELIAFFDEYSGWVVFHNAKFDLVSLSTLGIKYSGKFYDTMLMAHLVNENMPISKSLDSCVKYYCKTEGKKDSPAFKALLSVVGWEGITADCMQEYGEWDAKITLDLYYALVDKFQKEVPEKYWNHKQDFLRTVIKMESRGILIDQEKSREKAQYGTTRMEELTRELKVNPGSPKGLKSLLIDKLDLPVVKLTKKGYELRNLGTVDAKSYASFDKEAMTEYEEILERVDNPTAKLILEYRGWQKTVSSNYMAYLELVSPDGRLRPNYKLHGTKTGRMSCEKPNLQQIPRESEKEWNGDLKKAFVPEQGYVLVEFDYSQLELRLGTAYAYQDDPDAPLKRVFAEGRDIFTEMSGPLGLSRQDTKTFVYSTQYGAGLNRLMHVFRISKTKAENMREDYRRAYPGFVKVSNMAAARCRNNGKVKLWSGRHRHFMYRKDEAHKAFNSVIQGGAADIVEHVMVRLMKEVDNEQECRMLLQVHDSVVFEIRKDLVDHYRPKILEIMSDVRPDFGVVFAVDSKIWGE